MANAPKLFQTLREYFKIIGIHPLQLNHGSCNLNCVIILLFMTLNVLSAGGFLMYGADNVRDYGISYYTFITELVSVACLLSFRNNMETIFELIDEFEAFIEKSELFNHKENSAFFHVCF